MPKSLLDLVNIAKRESNATPLVFSDAALTALALFAVTGVWPGGSLTGVVITAGKTLTVTNTVTLTATDGATLAIGAGGTLSANAFSSATFATAALDNLASVSINTSLLAQTGVDLGSTTQPFRDVFLFGGGTFATTYLRLTGTPTGARVVTFPDASITVARSDAAQTLTGSQTLTAALLANATGIDLGSTVKPFHDLFLHGAGTFGTNYFQITGTPTAARVVTLPNATFTVAGLEISNVFTVGQSFPIGSQTAPGVYFAAVTNTGMYSPNSSELDFTVGGTRALSIQNSLFKFTGRDILLELTNSVFMIGSALDTKLGRLAAQSWVFGGASSATPVAYTLTIGEGSRAGTDSNVAGATGTLESPLGTGNSTPSTLLLRSPIAVASGTGAQTYATGLTIKAGAAVLTNYAVASLPAAATAGAGATAFVTDASTTVILGLGLTVVGGGANKVPVYSDGTNWIIG